MSFGPDRSGRERYDPDTTMVGWCGKYLKYELARTREGRTDWMPDQDQCFAGLAHRLDRGTSGAVIVGKTKAGYKTHKVQMHRKQCYKEYCCLVYGVTPERGE